MDNKDFNKHKNIIKMSRISSTILNTTPKQYECSNGIIKNIENNEQQQCEDNIVKCHRGYHRRNKISLKGQCSANKKILNTNSFYRTPRRFCWSIWTEWFLIGVSLLVFLAPGSGLVYAQKLRPHTHIHSYNDSKICPSVDIRNSVQTFEKLRGCRVVEGFVQILLFDTDTAVESLYENISFPELTEITGYLLLYRVNGLRSLGRLFPNLAVIRGQKLFFNYAFVVFEMSSLQEIGLYSLTDIIHGLVRIDKNPSLCYVNTIDWDLIAHEGKGEHFIKSNKLENECPICPGDDGSDKGVVCPPARIKDLHSPTTKFGRHLCWNRNFCQKVCPEKCRTCNEKMECCHESCLGSCTGSKSTDCTVCRQLSIGGENKKCLQNCPVDTYEFMNRRCIHKSECYNQKRPPDLDKALDETEYPYKAFNGSCLLYCPTNFYEVNTPEGRTCEPCKGMCRKDCPAANVDSIGSAQQLRGCTHIKGSLEIQIRGGRNVVKELEDNLNMIEEIDGYLKIVRSFPLVSLNFLRNLRIIHGNTLENSKYVFVVLDNQNLQELWDWDTQINHTLQIKNGRLFFHFNPKLCLYKIERLKQIANLSEFDNLEVAPSSNGDKVACNVTELVVQVTKTHSTGVVLKWPQFTMYDPRSLLGYVVYSIEAPKQNITLYDGRDACGGDGWRVDDVSNPEADVEVYHILTHLKPYTQYAFYVKTYTIATERSGAQSQISYFRTLPDVPTVPLNLKVSSISSHQLSIQWLPPLSPNGNVTHYEINATWEKDDATFLQQRDYCLEPPFHPAEDKKTEQSETKIEQTTSKDSNDSCSCDVSDNQSRPKEQKETEVMSQINFENELHNRVYIKRTDVQIGDIMSGYLVLPEAQFKEDRMQEPRRKREIDVQATKKRYTADKNLYHSSTFADQALEPIPNKNASNNATNRNIFKILTYTTSHILDGLQHFAKYTISVKACRERENANDIEGDNCSPQSIVTFRTLKKEGVDFISKVTVTHNSNSSNLDLVRLTWEEPLDPNGIILTYSIEYTRVEVDRIYKPTVECITQQMFHQKKKEYILKDLPSGNYSVRVQVTTLAGAGPFSPVVYFFIEESSSSPTTPIILGIFAVLLVVIIFLTLYYIKRRLTPTVPNMKLIATVNPEYVSTAYVPDDWEVPRKKIEFIRELGQGSFGMVYEGIARDVVKGKPEMRCAIKTVNEHATDRERIEFLNEASVMKAFDTTHVVQLLGVVSQGQPTLVVMELMANGDLKSYLRSHRPDAESYNPTSNKMPPTLKRILQMAIEIADGMAYLAAKKFVHRDLAARNCMVADDLTVKIGDFGMTRDIYETDYYRKGTKGLLPVRWMAPESLKDGVFTSSSDAWSYGVVLWEMATLASQPYQGLSNDQVLRYVIDGGIMERPENCPDKLYNLMSVCWQHKPSSRPTFLELANRLLEDACPNFTKVSFYHSNAGIEARTMHNSVAQDDPSTPLRSKDIEDSSLGSGSDHDSELEGLVDDVVNSDIDAEHVTIDFPRFQAASFKDNQKIIDTSGPSLFAYKDNVRSQATSGPSPYSFNEQSAFPKSNDSKSLENFEDWNDDFQKVISRTVPKVNEVTNEASTTANGYVGGRPINGTTNKTTQC